MSRDDGEVANCGVDRNSYPQPLSYPQDRFMVRIGPHYVGHYCSLNPGFPSAFLALQNTVKPAFAFALYGEFLTLLSRPLGAPDILSGAYRPSQTTEPADVPPQKGKVSCKDARGWCYTFAPRFLAKPLRRSHLHCTPTSSQQQLGVVNCRGVFSSHRSSAAYSPRSEFIEPLVGTAGISLSRWCKPAINRQGITLP